MPKSFLTKTLAELLGHEDQTIYRNSMSILKRLQRIADEIDGEEIPLQRIAREMDSKQHHD